MDNSGEKQEGIVIETTVPITAFRATGAVAIWLSLLSAGIGSPVAGYISYQNMAHEVRELKEQVRDVKASIKWLQWQINRSKGND